MGARTSRLLWMESQALSLQTSCVRLRHLLLNLLPPSQSRLNRSRLNRHLSPCSKRRPKLRYPKKRRLNLLLKRSRLSPLRKKL